VVSAEFRTIFAHVSPEDISAQWGRVTKVLNERFDKAAVLMLPCKEEVGWPFAFPQVHWRQIGSTNLRLNPYDFMGCA
jgi:transposase-like protein